METPFTAPKLPFHRPIWFTLSSSHPQICPSVFGFSLHRTSFSTIQRAAANRGKVLDVTNFLADHPGGEEFILKHAGRDVENAMNDVTEHVHSESAYDMLDEFVIGRLGAGENIVNDEWVATDDFAPEDTDRAADYEKNQFLDLRKALMRQMWDCNFRHVFFAKKPRTNV